MTDFNTLEINKYSKINKKIYKSQRFYSTLNKDKNPSTNEDKDSNNNALLDIYQKINNKSVAARYLNIEESKSIIYQENNNKSGIYMFINKQTGSYYIGSSNNLGKRLSGYLSKNFLDREILKTKSKIYSALLKYGYGNFELIILEHCDIVELIKKEQYFMDLYKPDYNILKFAGSSMGFRHSEETIIKFKNRELTDEQKLKLQKHMENLNIELNMKKRIKVEIFDLVDNVNNSYDSIRDAADAIGTDLKTIKNPEKSTEIIIPYRGRYVITILRNEISDTDYEKRIELARENIELGFNNWKKALGIKILVNNIQTNETIEYDSISEVSKVLKVTRRTVSKRLEDQKLINNLYKLYYKE